MSIKPFSERKLPGVICMFDVDGTLTPARRSATPEILAALKKLREYTAVAIVGGSDFNKIKEQLQEPGVECECGAKVIYSRSRRRPRTRMRMELPLERMRCPFHEASCRCVVEPWICRIVARSRRRVAVSSRRVVVLSCCRVRVAVSPCHRPAAR
jgi:HAD superfamily hydrolase (TIGR01484 family)